LRTGPEREGNEKHEELPVAAPSVLIEMDGEREALPE